MGIEVAVGVIRRGDAIYVTQRADGVHQGGKWEFPGGKMEAGETPVEALKRELFEEVGIHLSAATPISDKVFDYGDKTVHLWFYLVSDFRGEPHGKEGQQGRWVPIKELSLLPFPAANQPIIAWLQSL